MPPARGLLVVASLAGVAWMLRALVLAPPPLAQALAALGAYLALVVAGLANPGWGMFADVVTEGPSDARGVALTFDLHAPERFPEVVDLLAPSGAKATFFLPESLLGQRPELASEVVARGHDVGVLGETARRARRGDLSRVAAIVASRPRGRGVPIFRAAGRFLTAGAAARARDAGFHIVGESVGGLGWSRSSRELESRIVRGLRDGAIVRLVVTEARSEHSALPEILLALERLQLGVVPLSDWLADDDEG